MRVCACHGTFGHSHTDDGRRHFHTSWGGEQASLAASHLVSILGVSSRAAHRADGGGDDLISRRKILFYLYCTSERETFITHHFPLSYAANITYIRRATTSHTTGQDTTHCLATSLRADPTEQHSHSKSASAQQQHILVPPTSFASCFLKNASDTHCAGSRRCMHPTPFSTTM